MLNIIKERTQNIHYLIKMFIDNNHKKYIWKGQWLVTQLQEATGVIPKRFTQDMVLTTLKNVISDIQMCEIKYEWEWCE